MKYVVDDIDEDHYSGLTPLYGFEYRRDLNRRWEMETGLHAEALHPRSSRVIDYQTDASVGHSLWRNLRARLGYKFDGFQDDDFTGSPSLHPHPEP